MKPITRTTWTRLAAWPSAAWGWPHLQRLAERWLRQWGYACAGLALGLSGMGLAQPEVGEAYATALEAQARLEQTLAEVASGLSAPTPAAVSAPNGLSSVQVQRLWGALPVSSRPETLWTLWQQALAAHDLRLQSLQALPSNGEAGRGASLVSHVAAWRVLGRFEDWARVWAACAEHGPLCAIERISVVPVDPPGEVQIDAVMRFWMRLPETQSLDERGLADGWGPALPRRGPADRWRTALFAPSLAAEAGVNPGKADGRSTASGADAAAADAASLANLPEDPQQWPLARIRLAGVWQHGGERLALLSAGSHTVTVRLGQRVALEGYRVAEISDKAVHLRLGHGAWRELTWAQAHPDARSGGPLSSAVHVAPPSQVSLQTTGSPAP
ncbi:hypothetical protein ACHEXK_12420 [Limnohabitans sp. DCL3]|uniref:hypothetical protein n=1 Tax=Limnohabitans sp. DCL3 TaxID=3374103 RepID=UPI003A879A62